MPARPARKPQAAPEVAFTHLDKPFFPVAAFTKGDLVRYYVDVAPFLLPHLRDRPATLIRFPDGVDGERFYAKNAPAHAPDWIKTFAVPRRHREGATNHILINDAATLAWCANLGAIELHVSLHRAPKLERPTHLAFDLDPGEGADLLTCAQVALLVKELLDPFGLVACPKVSGSKGLQLYVPLNTATTYEATGAFAQAVARLLEQRHPELVVSRMTKILRKGRVLIDWSQNTAAKTTVAVYSVRGKRDTPFVSMPVTWTELRRALRAKKSAALHFSPAAALRRLKKLGDLFEPVLTLKQKLPRAFAEAVAEGRAADDAPAADSLRRYRQKRDFTRTREPEPRAKKTAKPTRRAGQPRFVIQKHAATRLHYDLRLEMAGTLKSWAVPKGLSTEVGVKRAAIEVEDHPLGYLKFEGAIPKGQYGGGTVMVWDIGTYELLAGSVGEGSLKFVLRGEKLKGEWHLFKIRDDAGKAMWLVVRAGKSAKPVSARRDDASALSGRSMARIARDES